MIAATYTFIGNTPLVSINLDVPATVLAKLEYLNPGGSIKDRSALYMIEKAEKEKNLAPGSTIIDASSGNQGIATAMIGTMKGYNVIITVPEKISREKLQTMKAYGAHVIICPETTFIEDTNNYHSRARMLHKNTANSHMLDQYFNTSNADAYYYSLGPEIWKQTKGMVTHFFAAAGTGGTISGVGRYLKKKNPHVKIIALDAANSYRSTNGNPRPYQVEGMGIDFDSPVIDYSVIDEIITISDDNALSVLKLLSQKHGLLVGPSSGAVIHGIHCYKEQLTKYDVIVAIFGDSGRAYLTRQFY